MGLSGKGKFQVAYSWYMHAKLLQSCPTLCDPMDCSLGSSVHGIGQARILEWIAMPSPGDLPDPGIEPTSLTSPAWAGGFFTPSTSWEAPQFLVRFVLNTMSGQGIEFPGTGDHNLVTLN